MDMSKVIGSLLFYSLLVLPLGAEEEPDLHTLSLEELLDVPVTTPTVEESTVRKAPATIYVITERMIRERGYNFLYDALRDAPGFDIIWMGGLYGPILNQHGVDTPENNKMLVMINGVVDNNLSAGTAQIYMQYSLHNVKQIEIIYGPASALYGANAMTGLINIVTYEGKDLQGVRIEEGSIVWDPAFRRSGVFAAIAAGKSYGHPEEQIDVSGAFHFVETDGPDLRIKGDTARSDLPEDPGQANYYFSRDYKGSSEKGTFLAQARILWKKYGLTLGGYLWQHRGGQGTYGHEGFTFLNSFRNKPDTWNFRNTAFSIDHDRKWNVTTSNHFSFIFRNTTLLDGYDAYFDQLGTGPDGPGTAPKAGARYYRPDHSFKLDDHITRDFLKTRLTIGFSVEFQRVSDYQLATGHSFAKQMLLDQGPRPTIDEDRLYDNRNYGGYLEHIWNLMDNFALTTGLRVDVFQTSGKRTPVFFGTADYDSDGNCVSDAPDCKTREEAERAGAIEISRVYYLLQPYHRTRNAWNPRLGAVYTAFQNRLTLKLLYGEGFRMPTVRELFSVTGSRYSNPALHPEKIRTVEMSTIYQWPQRGLTELNFFATSATDLVQLSPGTVKRPGRNAFLNQFQNVGRMEVYGFDFKSQFRINSKLDIFGHYSFQVPRFEKSDVKNLSHNPDTADPLDFSRNVPRQATHKGTAGISLYLLGGKLILTPRWNMVGERRSIITSPLQSVDGYVSWNTSIVWKNIGCKNADLQVTVYNITHNDILDPGFRTANKFNDFPAAHPQPGMHFYTKLVYRF